MHIIIITNQIQKGHVLQEYLTVYGMDIEIYLNPICAIEKLKAQDIKCILIDYAITEIDCFQLCELVSKLTKSPILIFGGSPTVEHECKAFDVGCSEYIQEPFVLDILLRRLKNVLKLKSDDENNVKKIMLDKYLVIDIINRSVAYNESVIHLTYKEFEILKLLALNPNRIFSRDEIIDSIWPVGGDVDPRAVDSHIKNIRKKTRTQHIEVIRNIGYRITKQHL